MKPKEKVIATYEFECPQCGVGCKSVKLAVDEAKSITLQGRTFEGGLKIETTHSAPHCSMFLAMEVNEFLHAHVEKRLANKEHAS